MILIPTNGHVIFAACTDPRVDTGPIITPAGQDKNTCFGQVISIDEKAPVHICAVGDVVYCRAVDLTGKVAVDEGNVRYIVREQMIFSVCKDAKVDLLDNKIRAPKTPPSPQKIITHAPLITEN